MKLNNLVGKYLQSSFDKTDAITYISEKGIDREVPEVIIEFIEKFNNNEFIREQDFLAFSNELSKLNEEAKNCIIHLLYTIGSNKYEENKEEIENAVTGIERNLKEGREIPKSLGRNAEKYKGLLNCYQLFAHHISISQRCPSFSYPGITHYTHRKIAFEIPFAINALRLIGELPKTDNFNGLNLSKPFYPLTLQVVKQEKVSLKKGVKDSDDYFPYKMVSKIAKGDTGDNTFVATNGKKILFVRGVEHYSPNAVLASKIATLVSSDHFSSERLLDNRLVGSRGIPGYAVSVADNSTRNDRKRYIEVEKKIFPGSGIIDEVTNFVCETDPNIENFGFSSRDIYQSHLTKIDFDRCSVNFNVSKDEYERDILTRPYGGIYHNAPHVQPDPAYIKEKLFARLKLSMLPTELFSSLTKKAFAPRDTQSEDRAIEECTNRSNIALELFFEHPQVKFFLKQDPSVLNQCYQQVAGYISTHFANEDQELLQRALRKRVEIIQKQVEKKIGVNLVLTDYIRAEIVEIPPLLMEHQIVASDGNSFVATNPPEKLEQHHQRNESIVTKSESTFISRNWLKLSSISLFTLVGVVGLTVGAAVVFGAGLVVGGAILGAKIVYDEYQYRASNQVNETDNKDELRPSPSVQNLIQQAEVANQQLDKEIASAEDKLVQAHKKSKVKFEDEQHILSSNFEIK